MKLKTLELALSNAIINPIGSNSTEDLQNYLKARDEIIALANLCEDGLNTHCSVVRQIDDVTDFSRDLEARIDHLGDIISKLYHHHGLSPDDISAIEMYIH